MPRQGEVFCRTRSSNGLNWSRNHIVWLRYLTQTLPPHCIRVWMRKLTAKAGVPMCVNRDPKDRRILAVMWKYVPGTIWFINDYPMLSHLNTDKHCKCPYRHWERYPVHHLSLPEMGWTSRGNVSWSIIDYILDLACKVSLELP